MICVTRLHANISVKWLLATQRFYSKSKGRPKSLDNSNQADEEQENESKPAKELVNQATNYQKLANEILYGGEAENRSGNKPLNDEKLSVIVPQVPSTDYIPRSDIDTEGLFAGYKPLFLGNSPLDTKSNDGLLDGLFSSLKKLKNAQINSENNTVEIDVSDVLHDLKKDNQELQRLHEKVPKIPWDASISGLVYNDQPFKGVPRSIVSKLKPFKLVRVEKRSQKHEEADEMIKLRFHSSRIKDEIRMVDLMEEPLKEKKKGNTYGTTATDVIISSKNKYETEKIDYAYKFQFIEADQRVFKNNVAKITRVLAKEFWKVSHANLASEFNQNYLPLYIYVDRSLQSRKMFQSFLYKKIMNYINPLLDTLSTKYESEEQTEKFRKRLLIKVDSIVENLSNYLPSVYFTGTTVDCLLHPSPVPGFGRIHWLKPSTRRNVFVGKNISKDYVFNISYDCLLYTSRCV